MAARKTKPKPGAQTVKGDPAPNIEALLPRRLQEQLLPLEGVPDDRFEHLCVDLAEREPGIVRAELKRTAGVRQFGVDVEGFDAAQAPVLVISSKRYQAITAGDLKTWTDDFLNHWPTHWLGKGVCRFVLAVTVGLNNDDLNAAIAAEAKRFAAIGVGYEVWGLQALTSRLKANADLIPGYFHPAWKDAIAGYSSEAGAYAVSPIASAPVAPVGIEALPQASGQEIAKRYGEEIVQSLESALERFREGRTTPLVALLARLKEDRVGFDALSAEVKSRLLRAEASLAFARDDAKAAREALTQAWHFHVPPDRVGEAQLLHAEGRSRDAIALLAVPANQREWELLLALILEEDGTAALFARPAQSSFAASGETHRLRAIAHTLDGNLDDALAEIEQAIGATPHAFGALMASAIIRFTVSLSPRAPRQFGPVPNPIHPSLARDDDASVALRRDAIVILDRLLLTTDRGRDDIALWRIAILLCGKQTVENGIAALEAMVRGNYPPPAAILWALAYGLKLNHRKLRKGLELLLEQGKAAPRHLAALLGLRSAEGKPAQGLKALDRFAPQFSDPDAAGLFAQWRAQLSTVSSDATAFRDALVAFHTGKDPQPLLAVLSGPNASAEQVLGGAEMLFGEGLAAQVNALREPLLGIGTADASELAARAALAASDGLGVLTIVGEARRLFPHQQVPHRLRILEVNAHLLTGQVGQAVRALEAIDAREPHDTTRLQIAKMRLSIGDQAGARRVLESFKPSGVLPGRDTLPLAQLLHRDAPDIARMLLENTSPEDLRAIAPVPAFVLANNLGIGALATALAPDFQRVAQDEQSQEVIVFDNVEDVLEMLQEQQEATDHNRRIWLQGQVPLHIAFDHKPREFLLAAFGRRDVESEWDMQWPMLVRAGIRPPDRTSFQPTSLRVDVTAIILAQRLNILCVVEKLAPIRVPANLAEALLVLIEAIDQHAPALVPMIDTVLGRIARGELPCAADADRTVLVVPNEADDALDPAFAALVASARGRPASALQTWLSGFEARIAPDTVPAKVRLEIKAQEAVRLEHNGLLAEFLGYADCAIQEADIAYLRDWLLRCKSDNEKLTVLTTARAFVAERLLSGAWQQVVPAALTDKEQTQLERSGALLRSLLALVKESRETDSFTWVEDRAASAAVTIGNSKAVDILDVLAALRRGGHLSDLQIADCHRRLLRYGYGFWPYDIDTIVARVRAAPVRDGRLVETPELTELRRHFALQVDRLRLANPAISGRDEHGAQAELRFGAWLMHLATKVLPLLWNDEGADLREMAARANWVWETLHADQSGFLPLNGATTPDVRRVLGRQGLEGLVVSVLQLNKQTFRAEQTQRARYSEWFFSHVVGPVEMFDPDLVTDMLTDMATQFASLLVDADPPDAPGLQKTARAVVLRAINPMPEPWRSGLLQAPPLASRLDLHPELLITLRGGVTFSSREFYRAASEAFAGHTVRIKTQDDRSAEFGVDAEDHVTITLTDNPTFVLSDDDMALCHPDVAKRRAALERIARTLMLSVSEEDALWVALESEPDASRRFERLQQHEQASYPWRLQRLRAELDGDRQFNKDLVTPPAPAEILRFLGLPPDTDVKGLDQAFAVVAARTDVFEALKRTAGLGVPYDAAANAALATAILNLDGGERGHAPSPLYALRTSVALAREGKADWQPAAQDLLDALENLSGLFLSVLRWTARHVLRDAAWKELSPRMRQALAWLHADIITAHLVVGRAEAEATAEMFEALDKPGVWRMLDDFDIRVGDIAAFDNEVGFRAWVLGLLCAELAAPIPPGDVQSRMRKAVALENGDAWIPQIVLLARPDRDPPFQVAVDSITGLHSAGVLTATAVFDAATTEALLERLIREAEQDGGSDVVAILPYFRFREVPKDRLDTLVAIAKGFDPFRRFGFGTPAYNLWLNLVSALYGLRADKDGFQIVLEERIAEARAAAARPDEVEEAFAALAEMVFQFGLFLPASADERFKTVLSLLDRLAAVWPAARPSLRRTLSGLIAQIAPEHAVALWDLLLKWLRAP